MSFHPLLVGGNPFTTTSIYSLIAYLERKWGVWFAKGGTGAIVQALVELFVSLGGTLELRRRGRGDPRRERPRHGRAARAAGAPCRRRSWCRTATRRRPTSTCCRRALRKKYTDAQDRSNALFDEPVRRLLRDQEDLSRSGAPHDPARAALPRAARRHLRQEGAGAGLQPLPARADADRSVAGAARLRELLRAVAGAAPRVGHDWAPSGRRYRRTHLRVPRADLRSPDCARTW